MNTLYLDGNYIIADDNVNGIRYTFPRTNTYYDEERDSFLIKRLSGTNELLIPHKEVSLWTDDLGTAFSEASLRSFLRVNTDFKAALGGSSAVKVTQVQDVQSNFVDGTVVGEIAYAQDSEGKQWLPGKLGGTYYPKGWYVWNGTEWVSDRNAIANQLENNLLKITSNENDIGTIESVLAQELLDREADDTALQLQIDGLQNNKSDIGHTHTKSEITDFNDSDYATASQGSNADTAFGWGDHSTQGYLTSFTETDPVFQASEASNFVAGDKANLDNQSGVNSGDETTTTIQTKRPLKTINGETIEGVGDIEIVGGDQAFVNQSALYKAFSDVTPGINNSTTYTPLFYKPAVAGTFDDTIFAPVANGVQLLKDLENLTIMASVFVTSNGARTALGVAIEIDGVVSNVESTGYIRAASGHNEDDFRAIETFSFLPAGTVITAQSKRNAGASNNTQSVEDKGFLSVFGFVPDTPGVVIGFPTPIITSISMT